MKRRNCGAAIAVTLCLLLSGCGAVKDTPSATTVTTSSSAVTTATTTQTTVTDATTGTTDSDASTTATTKTASSAATTRQPTSTTQSGKTIVTSGNMTTSTTQTPPVSIEGERRCVWVSYIELDTLLQSCSNAAQGKAAIDRLLDTFENYRMNTVFFHVRANSDAYYNSAIFKPASAAKKLLNAGFDPLAYAVEAAHKKGMELHAWVNPYRIGKDTGYQVSGPPTFSDNSNRRYYVPTSVAAQKLILDGIRELLENYAVDGIQYDDYFYPEGLLEEKTVYSFESADYESYQKSGGKLSVGDWRRAGVDALVAATHALTAAHGKIFGISPSHDVQKTHDKMFADSKKWLAQSGYVDYICPQIYFGFEHSSAAFDKMTDQWLSYPRDPSVDLYVGMALYKMGLKEDTWAGNSGKYEWANHTDILKRSVVYLRSKGINGLCFYSASHLTPATCTVDNFQTKNKVTVAEKELKNLLSVL